MTKNAIKRFEDMSEDEFKVFLDAEFPNFSSLKLVTEEYLDSLAEVGVLYKRFYGYKVNDVTYELTYAVAGKEYTITSFYIKDNKIFCETTEFSKTNEDFICLSNIFIDYLTIEMTIKREVTLENLQEMLLL